MPNARLCRLYHSKSIRLADPVKPEAVRSLLSESDRANAKERSVGSGGARLITPEDKDNVMVEVRDERSKVAVHKSFIRKN